MTAAGGNGSPDGGAVRKGRSVLVAIAVVTLFLAWAAFSLQSSSVSASDVRRSALRVTLGGVAGLQRTIEQLGTPTALRLTPLVDADPLRGVLVLLQPVRRPTPREVHALLQWVRGGGALIHAPGANSPVFDSLGLVCRAFGPAFAEDGSGDAAGRRAPRPRTCGRPVSPEEWLDEWMKAVGAPDDGEPGADEPIWMPHLLTEGLTPPGRPRYVIAPDTASEEEKEEDAGPGPAPVEPHSYDALLLTGPDSAGHRWAGAAEIPLGAGRIVTFADAEPLSNHRAAEDPLAVLAVRAAVAYASPGDTVFFDEFSQGLGGSSSPAGAAAGFLVGNRYGRPLLHLGLVCFLALACTGLRFGSPRPVKEKARRSSVEHVTALSAVYRSAQARKTAAVLLLGQLAAASRLPVPHDLAEAGSLLEELEKRGGQPLHSIRQGLEADPLDLTAIARGIDDHTGRKTVP